MRKLFGAFALSLMTILTVASWAQEKPRRPGPIEGGFLLPNGWKITPAGTQVPLTDLPLNIQPTPDGQHVLVATSGFNEHTLSLINLETAKVVDQEVVRESWFGLGFDPASGMIWWSGGAGENLHRFSVKEGELTRQSEAEPAPRGKNQGGGKSFLSGVTYDPKTSTLYSLNIDAGTITATDPTGKAKRVATIGGRPYDVAVARNGSRLYVSDWTGRRVLVLDPADLHIVARIAVGEHPNQIALHPTDDRLFVSCGSSDCVSVIDTSRGIVTETIMIGLFPKAPEGSTPDALAVSPDGETLYVASADNNCVVCVDIEEPNLSDVKGYIPTGWYPTAVAVSLDGKHLLVGVGKGNQTKPNPITKVEDKQVEGATKGVAKRASPFPYIGTTLSGALSIVTIPDEKQLGVYTDQVFKNCPYSDKLLTAAPYPRKTAIPTKVGDASPIKHVIYIIKENRTYDQVFGDIPKGNGDPSLTMFGRAVTPNHHKLAEEFVLLDNLYCNGQVSRDGHPWSTMAYNTDYIARDWMLTYSRRDGVDDDEEGNLANAPSGYLWDAAARKGVTYRSYGEYGKRVSQPDGTTKIEGAVPGLVGHMCPDFGVPKNGVRPRDTDNVETFLAEYHKFEAEGTLPGLMILSLGEDHTTGTSPGTYTPAACVGSNDLALGRLVEAVTKSKSWPETAIFVIEDDAQNGPDHVDAHRTVGLVISPYTRRNHLDSTQYGTVSMIRTMELILGLPPLSQYDAAATPMFESFNDQANLAPYSHLPAQIDLNARNTLLSYGAERSSKMDFSEFDKVDDFELNEILWRSVKGEDAPIPPTVRRAIAFRAVKPAR